MTITTTTSRLDVIDALRGFAIVSIMLLHNIEHFDFYFAPAGLPVWLKTVDKAIWDSLFFLFGGKSYAIFALLFGVTFYIQYHNRERRGEDFRARFAWRLVLLLAFGLFNSMFYHGDILSIYAVLGLTLIPVARLSNRWVAIIAVVLLLQPYAWWEVFQALPNPDEKLPDPASWAYFGRANDYFAHGSALQVWTGNLTNGKVGVIRWSWENGRIFQIPALFMLGMLAGRKGLFSDPLFWRRALLIAVVLFIPFYALKTWPELLGVGEAVRRPLLVIITSWSNVAFMVVLVSVFVLLFYSLRCLMFFSPLGRMSLTSYVVQSIIGTSIYYGFGLGMYQYTGASFALAIGLVLALVQRQFSVWWLAKHSQGPLESVWHKLTWLGSHARN
ncbi:DUF418 domain-containing protein [Duganella dendranthematis]|uniref:DUF418 domain-containing protein n=1 Tax=Duganella dendranthematis TaxID=2728021 RepID=A0ABX6MCZ7_9BURK|nr:DUF418 domain-containing protein [Duganella dendranthematis]QJD92198.1 DUF418 domain-containing protein [Duganella dendranthematis]